MGSLEESQPKKKSISEDDKRKEKIVPGSLMKAVMRSGAGEERPADGDQVIYHCTIRTLDGVVVESTRSNFGGKGIPVRAVFGKSKLILGLLEGIPTMSKGEVAMFKMKPEMHYGVDDCPIPAAESFPKDAELHFEIELIDFAKIKVISEDLGVLKQVIKEAQGWETPREPYEVKIGISMKSGDGRSVSSHKQGEPFSFTFGKQEVPKGLEMGIGTMSVGEKAIIYVTSPYLSECPLLPTVHGFEEIHFEVELVHFNQVRDILGDGRLIKRRIRDGRGDFPMDCPLQDSLLRVHYKGTLLNEEKTVFYDTKINNDGQPLEFRSGEGLVPEGFEMSVRLMLPGELALVSCPPDYAYDKFPRPGNVPEGAYVQWQIELIDFHMPKDWTGMNFREIMEEVEKIKGTCLFPVREGAKGQMFHFLCQDGNRLFKEEKFELAKAKYEKVLREFNHVNPQDDDEGKEFAETRNLLHLNVAACFLRIGEYRKSIETCNKVLDANPVHVKAFYRRGMAYMAVGDFDEARDDFNKMMSIDKSSEPTAKAALLKLKKEEQEVHRRAREQFKGLFDKKPGEIAEVTDDDRAALLAGENKANDQPNEAGLMEEKIEQAPNPPRFNLLSQLWPSGKRVLTSLGLDRCTIL